MKRFLLIAACVLGISPAYGAETLAELLRARSAAAEVADTRSQALEKLNRATQARRIDLMNVAAKGGTPALAKAKSAYDAAMQQEQAAMFAGLQAEAERRRTAQAVAEAVVKYIAEGDALERAAARAARGEVAPSATDTLSCEQDLCRPIPDLEHAALAQMGAVADTFNAEAWKGAERAAEISSLPLLGDTTPLLRSLRQAVTEAERTQRQSTLSLSQAQQALDAVIKPWEAAIQNAIVQPATADNLAARNAALEPLLKAHTDAADIKAKAEAALTAAHQALDEATAAYAEQARALKWAASLADAGYLLKANDPTQACAAKTCRPATGREAAAFIVIGAIDGKLDFSRRAAALLATYVTYTGERYVFAAPAN